MDPPTSEASQISSSVDAALSQGPGEIEPRAEFPSYGQSLNLSWELDQALDRLNGAMELGEGVSLHFESAAQRRNRVLKRARPSWLRFSLVVVDFLANQVLPKLAMTKRLYATVTRRRYRVMTSNEVLGRLVAAGFEVVDLVEHADRSVVCVRKGGERQEGRTPTFGLFVGLDRIGRHGEKIRVYKLRTMSPYSEFLQSHVHETRGLGPGGKFAFDSRITPWGRFLRRFWLDEIPMMWNFVRGDLKFFGVRPLSPHFLSLYPEDVRELRLQFRPGLIPPFYADLPQSLEAIVESERVYLTKYQTRPVRTDLHYTRRAVWNIVGRGARSG